MRVDESARKTNQVKEEPGEKETEDPPHRRNNLSASVSRPRERLCMIYSRIRHSAGRARGREGGREHATRENRLQDGGKVRAGEAGGTRRGTGSKRVREKLRGGQAGGGGKGEGYPRVTHSTRTG